MAKLDMREVDDGAERYCGWNGRQWKGKLGMGLGVGGEGGFKGDRVRGKGGGVGGEGGGWAAIGWQGSGAGRDGVTSALMYMYPLSSPQALLRLLSLKYSAEREREEEGRGQQGTSEGAAARITLFP